MASDRKSPLLSSGGGYHPPTGAGVGSLQYNSSAVESSPLLNGDGRFDGGYGTGCCARLCGPTPPSACCLLVPPVTASSSSAAVMAMALHHHNASNPGTWTADASGGTPISPALVMDDAAMNGGLFSPAPTGPPPSYALLEGGGNCCPPLCGAYTTVLLLVAALAACSSTELVMRKVVATNLYNYRWFMTELLCLITFVVTGVICLVRRHSIRKGLKQHMAKSGWPTKAMLYMAILDAAHSMCLFVAIGVVSGPVSVLLPQLVVPLSLAFRAMGGGKHKSVVPGGTPEQPAFRANHVIAFFFLIGGVLASFLPDTLSYDECTSGGRSRNEWIANVVVLVMGCIPAVVSHSYKTKFLSKTSIDPFFLNCCVSLLQFLIGMILAPIALELQYLSAPVPPPQVTPDPTPEPPANGGSGGGSGASDGGSTNPAAAALATTFLTLVTSAVSAIASPPSASSAAVAASPVSSVSSSVLVSSTIVNDPYPIPTDTTAPYTKNIFTNFGRGAACVFAHSSSAFQDQCESLGSQLSWDIAGYCLAMVGAQLAIALLMRRLVNAAPLVSWGLLCGIFVAALAFFAHPIQSLLPVSDGIDCLSLGSQSGVYTIVGAVVVCVGLAIAAIEPAASAASEEIDVWAQFEALEAADETRAAERRAQKEREREARERKRRERDPGGYVPSQIPRFQQRKENNAEDGGAAPIPAANQHHHHHQHQHLTRAQQAAAAAAAAGELPVPAGDVPPARDRV